MKKIKFKSGQEIWVEKNSVCGIPDYDPKVHGEGFETWEGNGYTGGHVSQSHWDIDQQYKMALIFLKQGFEVYDCTTRGLTGGYFPALKYKRP